MGKKTRLAIFDLDGTILDSARLWEDIDRAFLASIGKPWDPSYHDVMRVSDYDTGAKYAIARYQLKMTTEEIKARWEAMAVQAYQEELALKEGVKEVLSTLKSYSIPMVLCTLSPRKLYMPALERHGIRSYFCDFYSIDSHSFNKTTPHIFQHILDTHQRKGEDCIGFEDSPVAASSMLQAGIKTFLVADEGQPGAKEEAPGAIFLDTWHHFLAHHI